MTTRPTDRAQAVIHTWTNSYWFVALLALTVGVLAVTASLGFDWMTYGAIRRVYASDLLEAAVAALISGGALLKLQSRRRELLTRIQIVEDVNHHVRNALASVVLSASLREDEELNALVKDASQRIDWVLNDVLPQSIEGTDLTAAHPNWTSGRQLQPDHLRACSPCSKDSGGPG